MSVIIWQIQYLNTFIELGTRQVIGSINSKSQPRPPMGTIKGSLPTWKSSGQLQQNHSVLLAFQGDSSCSESAVFFLGGHVMMPVGLLENV